MRKKLFTVGLLVVMACSMITGCASGAKKNEKRVITDKKESSKDVTLTVWSGEEDKELIKTVADNFAKEHSSEANITIEWAAMEEDECRNNVLSDVLNAPDVYSTTDGDIRILAAGGAAAQVENADEVIKANIEASTAAMTENDKLYAYPSTADNSYFMYYNKKYFTEDDVKSLDTMLDVAAKANKKVAMDWSSGWYLYSFFSQTGLTLGLNEDGVTNYCTWNSKDGDIKGIDVAQAMAKIAKHKGFVSEGQSKWLEDIVSGDVIAFVSGVWDEAAVSKAWGSDYGAVKLPTYKCAGKDVQMGSFFGYKCIGVNPYSDNVEWAQKFAQYLTNEENQQLRFKMRGQGPSNINAGATDEIKKATAIQAVLGQAQYSQMQRVGGNYWAAAANYAQALLDGKTSNLQKLLDTTVEAITASTVQ